MEDYTRYYFSNLIKSKKIGKIKVVLKSTLFIILVDQIYLIFWFIDKTAKPQYFDYLLINIKNSCIIQLSNLDKFF